MTLPNNLGPAVGPRFPAVCEIVCVLQHSVSCTEKLIFSD
uniref:Uncharacterized protein n=1 Tax=Anguilla anguilla TaxID=7936 RepID=A0A0E9VBX1_ANGAN